MYIEIISIISDIEMPVTCEILLRSRPLLRKAFIIIILLSMLIAVMEISSKKDIGIKSL